MWGDWQQLWSVISAPDNVPIVALLFLVPFYIWYAFRQARANDELIAKLESDPAAAKTAHRKTQPYEKGWEREVHLALFNAHRIRRCNPGDRSPDGLVAYIECASRGAIQP